MLNLQDKDVNAEKDANRKGDFILGCPFDKKQNKNRIENKVHFVDFGGFNPPQIPQVVFLSPTSVKRTAQSDPQAWLKCQYLVVPFFRQPVPQKAHFNPQAKL